MATRIAVAIQADGQIFEGEIHPDKFFMADVLSAIREGRNPIKAFIELLNAGAKVAKSQCT